MISSPLKQIVFLAGSGWTHHRPGLKFTILLVEKFPSIFASVYVLACFGEQASAYLATHNLSVQQRIRIVASNSEDSISDRIEMVASLERGFGPWIAQQVRCSETEINGKMVSPPMCIIEDHINGGVSLESKDVHRLPVVSWWVSTAASLIGSIGNVDHGQGERFNENIGIALDQQSSEPESIVEEIARQVISDRLVCVPGLPTHYKHETSPHLLPPIAQRFSWLYKRWSRMNEHVDLMLFSSTYEMEPITAEAAPLAFAKPIQPFMVGPPVDLPSLGYPAALLDSIGRDTSDPVSSFLDRAYNELGPHSVVYIAFGTKYFPLPESTHHLMILVEEILSQSLRVVFSLRPESAKAVGISRQHVEKLTSGGNAIFPEWAKQLEVLEHPALHYFVSHAGWNSTTEALVRNVPMIFWPILADQPFNAMQIAGQHDCGFELIQIRTGLAKTVAYGKYGDVPIIGSDEAVRKEIASVLKMSKGERGKQQRMNAQALGKVIRNSIAKGGSGDLAIERFGKVIGL